MTGTEAEGRKMKVHVESSGLWKETCEAVRRYLRRVCGFKVCECPNCLKGKDSVLIIPLFTLEDSGAGIKPCLDKVKELRDDHGCDFQTVFLVLWKEEIPDFLHPERDMCGYATSVIEDPKFGSTDKAVFFAEIRFDGSFYRNIIPLVKDGAPRHLCDVIKDVVKKEKAPRDMLEKYYKTFVKFYDTGLKGKCSDKITNDDRKEQAEKCNELYNELHGIEHTAHSSELELFRAPVPFPFQGLLDARREIWKDLKGDTEKSGKGKNGGTSEQSGDKNKVIRLLLIDNKWNKVIANDKRRNDKGEENKEGRTLINLLGEFGLSDMFEVEVIGKPADYMFERVDDKSKVRIVWEWGEGQNKGELKIKWNNDGKSFKPKKEDLAFDFKRFRKDLEEYLNRGKKERQGEGKRSREDLEGYSEDEKNKKLNYAKLVYEKIKNAHFVLLDFFLDSDNIYFAFDFIRDITSIKNKECDLSLTWYFITSAVYDAVVKYAQSGLLAEYYESAVVSAGDDPANEKRGIIFVYKLLTFIWARLKDFKNHWKTLRDWFEGKMCQDRNPGRCRECLENIMRVARKFQIELEEMKGIFPELKESRDEYKSVAECLENLIRDFLWLPEADWQVIQLYVRMLDKKLKELMVGIGKGFSCEYIKEKIKERSDVY